MTDEKLTEKLWVNLDEATRKRIADYQKHVATQGIELKDAAAARALIMRGLEVTEAERKLKRKGEVR